MAKGFPSGHGLAQVVEMSSSQKHTSAHVGAFLLVLIYSAYISLGLPDGIMGTAWPELRRSFDVALNANWPIYVFGVVGGLISSFSAGALIRKLSTGRLLLLTTLLTSASMAGCAWSPWFGLIFVFAFFLGLGNGATDCAMNHFAATHLSSRHMNWLHGFWGVGVSSGTLLFSAVCALGGSWRMACVAVAGLQGLLAMLFFFSQSIWDLHALDLKAANDASPSTKESLAPARESLRLPMVWLSSSAFFLYCGVEFGTGVWATSLMQDSRGWSAQKAALLVTLYWGSLTVGRFMVGFISNRLSHFTVLRTACWGVITGTLLIGISSLVARGGVADTMAACGLLLTGFSLAPIFPTMMHDTPNSVAYRHSANLIGYQSAAANLGLTLLPGTIGTLMKHSSLEYLGFLLLVPALMLFAILCWKERMKGTSSIAGH